MPSSVHSRYRLQGVCRAPLHSCGLLLLMYTDLQQGTNVIWYNNGEMLCSADVLRRDGARVYAEFLDKVSCLHASGPCNF